MLTYDLMIPSSVNIENKSIATGYSAEEKKALLIEVAVPINCGVNITEIKKMTKYRDLKKEVKISWKLKSTKIVSVRIGAAGMMKRNLTEILKTVGRN